MKNLNQLVLSLFLTFTLAHCNLFQMNFPLGFGVVRFLDPASSYEAFLSSIGRPEFDNQTQLNNGYNLMSLDGFTHNTTYSTIESKLSPLSIWKRVFEIVLGNKPSIFGSQDQQVQRHIVNKQFKNRGSKLLMNVDLTSAPISRHNTGAEQLGNQIIISTNELNLDGVSIQFEDFHAVKDNLASDWLEKLLRTIRNNSKGQEFLIVLIVPSTYPQNIRLFKSQLVNALVDIFVLKYYNMNKADYTDYDSLFERASQYQGSSIKQLMQNDNVVIDICRTLIAKPAVSSRLRNPAEFIDSSRMSSFIMQAFNGFSWFAGLANLDHGADRGNFMGTALKQLRGECANFQNCIC